jgi:hypothetical protein
MAGPGKGVGNQKRLFALANATEATRQEDGSDKEIERGEALRQGRSALIEQGLEQGNGPRRLPFMAASALVDEARALELRLYFVGPSAWKGAANEPGPPRVRVARAGPSALGRSIASRQQTRR